MKIKREKIKQYLKKFSIYSSINDIEPCLEYEGTDEKGEKLKYIYRIKFSDCPSLIIKITKEKYTYEVIEEQCDFSEKLRKKGIPVAKHIQSEGKYCILCDGFHITLEEDLSESLIRIDLELAKKIGTLMGKMHKTAEDNNLHLSTRTIFDFMKHNEVDGSNRFYELINEYSIDSKIIERVNIQRKKVIEKIMLNWEELPCFGCQGDFSLNNLTLNSSEELCIFDFNIAGDSVLVADLVLEALLIAHEFERADQSGVNELFISMVHSYQDIRPLSKQEIETAAALWAYSEAFWFTLVDYRDHSLGNALKNQDIKKANQGLNRILNELDVPIEERIMKICGNKYMNIG